ncbi:MAG TPA: M23 family metallopeptidase [Gammaproteobacteria bacterium]|nr:M23 family metallopeptidase [Gammaproteobacteria bacterium]
MAASAVQPTTSRPQLPAPRPSAWAAAPKRFAGRIRQTLYQSARRTGMNRRLTLAFVRIFAGRVNYRHDIHAGDRFVVVCKGMGDHRHIVAAELDLHGRQLQAFRHPDGNGKDAWYSANGKPLRPTLLRTPVDYTRVSSPFSLHRLNPVLHIYRPHYGVDLAAPAGTPVHAAGDGRVTFRGRDGGYGKLIIIDNAGPYTTRYGHLRRFAKGIKVGTRVRQGEVIGYVGATGLATGPHLHFEIRVDGKPHPPLKVALPREKLAGTELVAYEEGIAPLIDVLDPTPRRPAPVEVAAAGGEAPVAATGEAWCPLGRDASLARCLLKRQKGDASSIGDALTMGLAVRP